MKFEIIQNAKLKKGKEKYFTKDMSFDCTPPVNIDINIIMSYVNLGVDSEDMCVKCLWGFSPKESWKESKLLVPVAPEGNVKLIGEYAPGFTWRIDNDKMWESHFDTKSGWYCIGEPFLENEDKMVKILANMIVVLDKTGELKAVWVQPEFI